jgi:hypothetical protein
MEKALCRISFNKCIFKSQSLLSLLPSVLSLAFSAPDKIREAYHNVFLRLLQDKLSDCTFSELMLDLSLEPSLSFIVHCDVFKYS